jgi:hypothetical protein
MSVLAHVTTDARGLHHATTRIRNAEGAFGETVDLDARDLRRLDGDHRWRMIICLSGEVWITQEHDVRDYVLTPGDMFLVSRPGSVLIEALCDASVKITPPLKSKAYRGKLPVFH